MRRAATYLSSETSNYKVPCMYLTAEFLSLWTMTKAAFLLTPGCFLRVYKNTATNLIMRHFFFLAGDKQASK